VKANDAPVYNQERAIKNYQAVMSGKKKYPDLTPIEREEVGIILRSIRSKPVTSRLVVEIC
jgi:hypothetical protein